MASNNSNYNKISVKTDSTVELIDQLAKLGFFKEKRKTKPKRATATGNIRQTGDMGPGYVRPILLQTTPGMTPQQIADVQERNNATVATLRAEIEQGRFEDNQQRLEDQQKLFALSSAAANRFGQIGSSVSQLESAVGKITNIGTERFRSAQEPGAGVYDPFSSNVILLKDATPDINEGASFTQSLNEGAPDLEQAQQIDVFPEEEGVDTGITPEALQQSEVLQQNPTARGSLSVLRNTAAREFGIGPVPDRDSSSSEEIRAYYFQLMDAAREEPDPKLTSKKKAYKGIIDYLDSIVNI
jgi:hypothetical protein